MENVACPSVGCVKQRVTDSSSGPVDLDAKMVKSVVGIELEDRWERLKERRKVDIGERLHRL